MYQGPGSPRKVLTELSLCKVPPQNESRPLLLRALHAEQLPGPLRIVDLSPGRHSACGKSGRGLGREAQAFAACLLHTYLGRRKPWERNVKYELIHLV